MIVCDPGIVEAGLVTKVQGALSQANVQGEVFAEVRENPSIANIEAGATVFRSFGGDGVVALGGGSAMDAGKLIALLVDGKHSLEELAQDSKLIAQPVPVVAVPTTAGYG